MVQAEPSREALTANGLVEHATESGAINGDGLNAKTNNPTGEDIHQDQDPMTLEEDGFGAEQVKAPQTVFGLTQEGEPGWAIVLSLWTIMRRQNPPNGVLVEVRSEGCIELLGNSTTAKPWISSLQLQDDLDQFGRRTFRSRFAFCLGGEEKPVFTLPQRAHET